MHRLFACLWLIPVVPVLVAADPVLRVMTARGPVEDRVRNGGFEAHADARFVGWTAASEGYRVGPGEGRAQSIALVCEAPEARGWRGASQTIMLHSAEALPLTIRGWSRAEGVSGSPDSGYSLYVDLTYADGTPLWGQTGNFRCGTHDWERQEFVILPEKPVRSLTLHCLLRGHAGKAWFDDVAVEELRPAGGGRIFQGAPMELVPEPASRLAATTALATGDGLKLTRAGDRLFALSLDGRDVTGAGRGGFLVRDVAAGSDVYGFDRGACVELGLKLDVTYRAEPDHVAVEGRLTEVRGQDRAILLLFALPVKAAGWRWHDDVRRARIIAGTREFVNASVVRCGTTGTMSVYPLAAIEDGRSGVALGLDMGHAAQFRLVHHAGTDQFFLAYDFGLVPDTARFPSAATFRLVVFGFDARGGFRAAWAKYMSLFPEHFVVRSRTQGLWMPFTDIGTVQGWEDFGFRYHEGNNNVGFDDRHGILSFRYTEPMTWWMPMAPELPRTFAEALRVRDDHARARDGRHRQMAQVSVTAAMHDADGHPALLFRNEPWANGAVWSLNPNPFLPATPNAATVHWNDALKARLYGTNLPTTLDGEYLDSLEGYVTADLNFRREHFRASTVPLSFASDTRRPALFKGLAVYEFTRWIGEDLHRMQRLTFANSVPYRFPFLCPWLDVMGTETDWLRGDRFEPVSHAQLAQWRTLAGAKPYLLLMNTDYERLAPHVERYFQLSLFYGFYPSMFSHNAAEHPYWQNPRWYNRDRPLFRKYIPIIRRVAEAGWQPVTQATTDHPAVWVERFGPDAQGTRYYTLYGVAAETQTAHLAELLPPTGAAAPKAIELLSGRTLSATPRGWPIELAPHTAAVVQVSP